MKICPYCKEEIRDDAAKCHHCQTVILPATTDAAISDKRVILVVDRGLIYFGKFALLLLTIFIMGGLVFYGVNLREALGDVQRCRNDAHILMESATKTSQETTGKLEDLRKFVEDLTERADSFVKQLDAQMKLLQATAPLVETIGLQGPGKDDVYELHKLLPDGQKMLVPTAPLVETIGLQGPGKDEVYQLHSLLPTFYKQVHDPQCEAKARAKLGDLALQRGEREFARSEYEKARALFRQLGDLRNLARVSLNLAMVELQLDRAEQARGIYEQAIELYKDVEDYAGLTNAYFGLAVAEEKLGNAEEASSARKLAMAVSPYQEVPR